jgi:16S rRNA (cytosine967-C5)-methyltransferase
LNRATRPTASARGLCLRVLNQWGGQGRAHIDEILHAALAASPLDTRDRAFATELVLGVLRHLAGLDFVIASLRDGPVDDETRHALRLGLYQLLHTRVAPHAAVSETVSLSGRARGLVNAVLRRASRELEPLRLAIQAAPAHIRWSHPAFLIERWTRRFGAEAAQQLCEWNNSPAPLYVRVNTLRAAPQELPGVAEIAEPSPLHPLALRVGQLPRDWIERGLCYVQDPSTLIACDLLAPQPGQRVLDACAAPGGKTSHLAALMDNSGEIVAADSAPERLDRLRENLARLGVTNARVLRHDWWKGPGDFPPASFDRILVDAPCTNTGVLRRRVDARWRLGMRDFSEMPARQLAIIRSVIPLLKPGGALVYSTCSIEPEENEQLVEKILAAHPALRLGETRQSLPFRDGMDGAFAARFTL